MSEKTKADAYRRGIKSLFSAGGLVLILIILVLVNLIFSSINLRWDATQDKIYSLSDESKKIVSELKEDVVIKFFYTKDNVNIPVYIKNYAQIILDFLYEYETYGKGKIIVEVYNPKVDSEEEEWANKYGIQGLALQTGETIYFGLVAMAADQEETIKMMDPAREEHLEYDITRIISRVQRPDKPTTGIISNLEIFGKRPNYMQGQSQATPAWQFVTELKKTYDVQEISMTSESIDDSLDLLILFHPKSISETLQYAIDQYVLKGGNVIAFIDPYCGVDKTPGPVKSSSLEKLFPAWGIKTDPGKILIDMDYATLTRRNEEKNPMLISPGEEAFNRDEIITGKLESMLFVLAGTIEKLPESVYSYEPLLQSSANSALVDSFSIRMGTEQIRRNFKATIDKYDLAVKIRGTFKTAFPGGKPVIKNEKDDSEKKEDKPLAKHLAEGEKNSTIIVVSDTDMLFDNYYIGKQNFGNIQLGQFIFNDNLHFFQNACELLTGSDELIGIRSRGKFERPFTKVEELENKAQASHISKEQELMRKLDETNEKLRELQKQMDSSQKMIISEKWEVERVKFNEEKVKINKELKEVRRNLRAEIETLGLWVKTINIALMPFIVLITGIIYAVYRRNKSVRLNREAV